MKDLAGYINEKFGIECTPGRKRDCPNCGHSTFSLKRDGSVAKCFHPSCLFVLTPGHIDKKPSLHKLLSELQQEWHKNLLSPSTHCQKAAWDYLTGERAISKEIIEGASIGIVPQYQDILTSLAPMLEELRKAPERKQPGRPKKGAFNPNEYADWLEEQGQALEKCISKAAGWLAFFYMDGRGRYCSIHFRKPYTKNFMTFKPKAMGLFGADLFVRSESKKGSELDRYGVVVEGEFDCMTIQTTLVNAGKTPALVVATGGTSLVDMDTLKSAIPKPVICQDRDGAGDQYVKNIAAEMNCEVCAPPPPSKDIDDFLRGFKDDHKGAYKALISVIKSRKPILKPLDKVKEQINELRCGLMPGAPKGEIMQRHEIDQKVAETIIDEMSLRGQFLRDGDIGFYISKETDNLSEIEPGNKTLTSLLNQCGINATEPLFKFVIEEIYQHAIRYGDSTTVHHFSHLKISEGGQATLYIAAAGNRMVRINRDTTEYVSNGTDGVMFISTVENAPGDIPLEEDCKSHLLDSLILDKVPFSTDNLLIEESRFLLKCWIFMLFYRELLPHKPILALIGSMGSGKTTTMQIIGELLFGTSWDVTPVSRKEGDFDTLMSNKILVVLDNLDEKIGWINDKLAVLATGGKISKRLFYTTNRMVEYPIIACVGITSRTPHFRRNDVADRLLILKTDSLHDSHTEAFRSSKDFIDDVRSNRKKLWSEILRLCQSILVVIDEIDLRSIIVPSARTQDFARFSVIAGRAWSCEEMAMGVWSKVKSIQREFTAGQDPFVQVMDIWVTEHPGLEVDSGTLAEALSKIAERETIDWPYSSGKSIGQKVRNMMVELREIFKVSVRKGAAKQALYTFCLKESSASESDSGAIPE